MVDIIFCKGSCQAWLYHCCAGLTHTHFVELSDDSLPFNCPIDLNSVFFLEVEQLKALMTL